MIQMLRLRPAAAIIAVVIIGGFLLSAPRVRDGAPLPTQDSRATTTPPVTLRDVYKKGVHTIRGSLEAPNACAVVTAEAARVGDPENVRGIQVVIVLTEGEGVCLQLPTTIKFSTTITAPAGLPLTATVNGAVATTTVL